MTARLRELRGEVEHIASCLLEFTAEHVFARYLDGEHRPTEAETTETAEAASLVRRLRPLARQTVDAELARAMRLFATRHLRRRRGPGDPESGPSGTRSVVVPEDTMRFVERLVGAEHAAEHLTLAAERELWARRLDRMASSRGGVVAVDERA